MARILIAEDEPDIALGLKQDLLLEGYQVEVVHDGVPVGRAPLDAAAGDGRSGQRPPGLVAERGDEGRQLHGDVGAGGWHVHQAAEEERDAPRSLHPCGHVALRRPRSQAPDEVAARVRVEGTEVEDGAPLHER